MGRNQFFIRFNSVSENFDSTQLMTHKGFTTIHSNKLTTQNGFLKFNSNRFTTQKKFPEFWLKSTHGSKTFPEFWFKSTHDSEKSGILIRINSWLNDTIHFQFTFVTSHDFFEHSTQVLNWYDLFGLSTQAPFREIDSNQLMNQAVSWRLESIQIMTQAVFQVSTHALSGFPSQVLIQIDSWLEQLPWESNQIDSRLKVLPHFRFKLSND